jgi:hypothetical protein
MRYNANISIHSFRERKDLDYPELSHIPHLRFADIPRSHLQTAVIIPSTEPTKLTTSVAWRRISEQDVLVLDTDTKATSPYARFRNNLTMQALRSPVTSDYLLTVVYRMFLMLAQSKIRPWLTPLVRLTLGIFYLRAYLYPGAPSLWSTSKYALYYLYFAALFRDPAPIYSLLLPPRILGRREFQQRLAVVMLSAIVDLSLTNSHPTARWSFAIFITIGLEGLVTIRKYFLLIKTWYVRNRIHCRPYRGPWSLQKGFVPPVEGLPTVGVLLRT